MATIYDVAKKSGYSITTVSKVLNNQPNVSERAKKKVMKAVQELGYIPYSSARTLATKKSNMIGVVFSEAMDVGMTHPFFSEVIEAFRKQVELYQYDLLFVSRNIDSDQSYHEHLRNRGVDGVIVVNLHSEDEEIEVFKKSSLPAVFIDLCIDEANVVFSDNELGCSLAIKHLYKLGHRKIAHIAGSQTTFSGSERLSGFKKAMKEYGLPTPDPYIVDGGYFTYEGGRTAMLQLLSLEDRPTAVFASGDNMAIGAIQTCKELNIKVPEEISIIGFDDIAHAKYVDPSLTTIRQDTDRIGRQAATLLLNEINENKNFNRKSEIPVRLVKRESCGPVNS